MRVTGILVLSSYMVERMTTREKKPGELVRLRINKTIGLVVSKKWMEDVPTTGSLYRHRSYEVILLGDRYPTFVPAPNIDMLWNGRTDVEEDIP